MSTEAKEARILDHPEITERCEHLIATRKSKKSLDAIEDEDRKKIKDLMTEFDPQSGDKFFTETAIIDFTKGRETTNQAKFREYLVSKGVSFSLLEEADESAKTTGTPIMVISPRGGSLPDFQSQDS